VPELGQQRAIELMRSGALFRYTPGVLSEAALAEQAMADYTGFRYAVGFNSCGSALFIALKCCGIQPGDKVLCNAFSFTAVPSAVHHASATPVYVDCTDAFVMDMDDLERKIEPDIKFVLLTHMRGKVANMQRVYAIAAKHGITVIEDCAHALGVQYDGVQLGRSSRVACFSTQQAKAINSGEGGFLMTDDDEIAAKAMCYAGCYEDLVAQHVNAPPTAIFDAVKKEIPNYSLRMSDLTACCIRPQIDTLAWFAGTADRGVNLPSRGWVEAAQTFDQCEVHRLAHGCRGQRTLCGGHCVDQGRNPGCGGRGGG
jgi:dTDP-4-amino-4,6-dideoxygalactose transaminase